MKRRMLAVLVALALAALGCVAVVAYVKGADRRAVQGRQAATVLVATKRIPAGTSGARVRSGGYTTPVVMPAGTLPPDAMGAVPAEFDTLVLTADVQPRQLLLRGQFGESTRTTGGLALPEGKLAVSIEVKAAARVAGFVRPGSSIAVFDTFTTRLGRGRVPSGDTSVVSGAANVHATRVLLPRVDVLAVGQQGSPGAVAGATPAPDASAKGGSGGSSSVLVTVAVDQAQAERLIHASGTGTLSLALLDDAATVTPGPGVDTNTLFP
ncbi:MAG TPA: Flp pilus assembly protein CpaB [Pilimelia sp.]|nr:Flp pilus assembly protein CpaB [Pilimelia sp.]